MKKQFAIYNLIPQIKEMIMSDSAPSAIVTATSGAQPVPAAPVINSVDIPKLVATIVVTLPSVDTDGGALGNLKNLKIFFAPTGLSDPLAAAPAEFPGDYLAGSVQTVEVTMPSYATPFDFEAEVSD